jgi:class 3 adenylate cyclase
MGYEELIAAEMLGDEGTARLTGFRDDLIRSFSGIRAAYQALRDLRLLLEGTLAASFAILGPEKAPGALSTAEVSAALANTILSGRAITPGQYRDILFWSLPAVLLGVLIIFRLRPFTALVTGLGLSVILGAAFSWNFILNGYWIDPLIPAAGCLMGTLVIFIISLMIIRRGARRFQLAYGPYVGKPCLKQLIRTGRPLPGELIRAGAAVIAVRKAELLSREDRGNSLAGAQAAEAFREEVSRLFRKAGGVIIGCDGDLVLACFGSPLERIALGGLRKESTDPYTRHSRTPTVRAAEFITELLAASAGTASWRFGVDTGECAFGYMPVSGYSAFGRPVVRSRILSSLTIRYNAQVIVSAAVSESLPDIPVRKLNILKENDGREGEAFYQLIITN